MYIGRKQLCFLGLLTAITAAAFSTLLNWHPRKASPKTNQEINRAVTKQKILRQYGELPLSFEPNEGQTDPRVHFLSRGPGYTLFLSRDQAILSSTHASSNPARFDRRQNRREHIKRTHPAAPVRIQNSAVAMNLLGANQDARISGVAELPGKSNYFIGSDPKKWRTNVPTYSRVKYEGIYPGIDLVYYGNQQQLEYDFVVASGADLTAIKLAFDPENEKKQSSQRDGVRALASTARIDLDGSLLLTTRDSTLRMKKPLAYQTNPWEDSGDDAANSFCHDNKQNRRPVEARFVIQDSGDIGFEVADYDHTKPLVIDPVLEYSTYLSGNGVDEPVGVAVDAQGNAYVAGGTSSSNFPTTPGAFQTTGPSAPNVGGDAFISKLNSDGSALIYSTYLGGVSAAATGADTIAFDAQGDAYVGGSTLATDFPVTPNVLQPTFQAPLNGTPSGFVTELNPDGSALVYSTYFGGTANTEIFALKVDASGNAYFTAQLSSIPYVSKLNPQGTALLYSTGLVNSNTLSLSGATGIFIDSRGDAYVTGGTNDPNFPYTPGALKSPPDTKNPNDTNAAFVLELDPSGATFIYSALIGFGSSPGGSGIAVDSQGNAYVSGIANAGFPTTTGAFQTSSRTTGTESCIVFELNPSGSALIYSTYLGGSVTDTCLDIAIDAAGNSYVAGSTQSPDFPVTPGAFQTTLSAPGVDNAFLTEINPAGSALVYSTFFNGNKLGCIDRLAIDSNGNVYVVGLTAASDFPTTPGAFQTVLQGADGGFVAKFALASQSAPVFSVSPPNLTFGSFQVGSSSPPQNVTLTNTSTAALTLSGITIPGANGLDFGENNTCGQSLAVNASCTISVTFTPSVVGSEYASIQIAYAGGTQTVSLTGTGLGPVVTLSPTSLNFAFQFVGQGSGAPLPVTLTNAGTSTLTIEGIAITGSSAGDFSQTNNCGAALLASASCTINVVFSSSSSVSCTTGQCSATLTVTDNAVSNNMQSVSLSGQSDVFTTVSPAPGGSASATVTAGQQAVYKLMIQGNQGFSGTVSLACAASVPMGTCTVSPNSVVASAATPAMFMVTESTSPQSSFSPDVPERRGPWVSTPVGFYGLSILVVVACLWAVRQKKQQHRNFAHALACAAIFALISLTIISCGGGGKSVGSSGTPPGTYKLTVTASSSNLTSATSLTLNVNP